MASKKIIYKKSDLQDYISGKLEIKSQLVESSALRIYTSQEAVKLRPDARLAFLTAGFVIIGMICLAMNSGDINWSNNFAMLGLSCSALGLLHLKFLIFNFNRKISLFKQSLKEPLEELIFLKEYLKTYLKSVDTRTSRYFNLITNNKVSNYLLLTNLQLALSERTAALSQYAKNPIPKNLKALDRLLRKDIEFQDGVGLDAGTVNYISISKIADAIDVLTGNLERSVQLMEAEHKIEHSDAVEH